MGLFLSCGRKLGVPLEWRRVFWELLELHQGGQGTFQGSRKKVGLLSRPCRGKGPHLALRGDSPGFSQVVAVNMGLLSSYDEDLRVLLVFPQ